MKNTTTTDTTTNTASLPVPTLRQHATELGIDPKGLKKAELVAAIDAAEAAATTAESPTAKRQATRAAKAGAALEAWGLDGELATVQDRIRLLRVELAEATARRDDLVLDGQAAGVPLSTMADLLGMAVPGVRAITLRQKG